MGKRIVGVASLGALLAVSVPAHAAEGLAQLYLTPASKWVLDYSEESCTLFRTFGEGDERVRLWVTSFGPGENYRVLVVGQPVSKTTGPAEVLNVRLGQDAEFREVNAMMGQAEGEPSAQFSLTFLPKQREDEMSRLDEADPPIVWPVDRAFETASETLHIDFGRKKLELRTGSMGPPLDAMRSCRNDLLTSWGLDPEAIQGLTRHPQIAKADVDRMMRSYPRAMSTKGRSAVVPVRLMVAADGSIESCTVQEPSPDQDFNDTVCSRFQSKLEPALGAGGQPIRAAYHTSVIFTMQGW